FTNNFFEFNIDSLYEIINDEKNIISKVKKDLNIFENLQIDKILKLKKFNFFEKDDCKKSISFIVFNEYNFNNESIHFESKNYIIRFITANPYHEFDNYNRFILFLKNRNIILEQDWDKLFFYI
ncbi:MAG: hypothetical protein N3A58_01615, partial [Spirochaetes bacterium]|nr:hypothetical protein [Spirochaetota bacterium]